MRTRCGCDWRQHWSDDGEVSSRQRTAKSGRRTSRPSGMSHVCPLASLVAAGRKAALMTAALEREIGAERVLTSSQSGLPDLRSPGAYGIAPRTALASLRA